MHGKYLADPSARILVVPCYRFSSCLIDRRTGGPHISCYDATD